MIELGFTSPSYKRQVERKLQALLGMYDPVVAAAVRFFWSKQVTPQQAAQEYGVDLHLLLAVLTDVAEELGSHFARH